jgi:hypothetical protein
MKIWKEGYTRESEDIPGVAEEEKAGISSREDSSA